MQHASMRLVYDNIRVMPEGSTVLIERQGPSINILYLSC